MTRSPAPGARVRPLRRAAVVVRDLERALTLYRGALGLAVWKQGRAGPQDAAFFRLLGLPPAQARYAILQAEGSATGMVGLFEVRGPAPAPLARPASGAAAAGEVALVFLALDVPALHQRIVALDLPVVCAPLAFAPPGGAPALEMTFRDFDGALVNLIESP